MDFKKHMIMKFNLLKQIKELEDENIKLQKYNLFLKDENIKLIQTYDLETLIRKASLQKNRAKLAFQKKQVLEHYALKYNTKTVTNSKDLISKDKKINKTPKVNKSKSSLQNHIRVIKVKVQKRKLKKEKIEVASATSALHNETNPAPEPISIPPIPIHIHKKIKLDITNDDDDDEEKSDNEIENDNIICIESDTENDVIHVDNDYDLVNEFSFTSSSTKI